MATSATAAAAGTGAHDTGESMEDELLVLPPDDVIQRLQVGSSLLKVNKKGVASKRHFRLSDDLLKLEWVPSSKSGSVGILPLLQVKVVSAGLNSSGFAKSNKAKLEKLHKAVAASAEKSGGAAETMSGYMWKQGGSKGGWKSWSKRWCVLAGCRLSYYKSPQDAEPKGVWDLSGGEVDLMPEKKKPWKFRVVTGQNKKSHPDRHLYTASEEEMNKWVAAIEAAAAAAATATPPASTGAGGGAGASAAAAAAAATSGAGGAGSKNINDLSLSLVSDGRSDINIVCTSAEELDLWLPALRAIVHYHRFSNEASLELYEEALRINAKDGHALVGMGEALERQGGDHFGEALMYYDKAQQIPSVGVKPWICAARVLQKQSKMEESLVPLGKALEMEPDNKAAMDYTGVALQATGKLEEAIAILEKCVAIDSSFKEAHYHLAGALQESGDTARATVHLRAAVSADPRFKWGYTNLGLALEAQGDMEGAKAQYEQALSVDADFVLAHLNLAHLSVKLNDLARAIEEYEAITRLQPTRVQHFVQLSELYARAGKAEKAITTAESALALQHDHAEACLALGHALLAKTVASGTPPSAAELSRAREHLQTCITAQPTWPDPHNTLGMLARQAGDLGAAQGHFEAALEKRPGWEAATANLEAVKVLQAERKAAGGEGNGESAAGSASGASASGSGDAAGSKDEASCAASPAEAMFQLAFDKATRQSGSNLSHEERQKQFFAAMKAAKAEESAKAAAEAEKELSKLDEEDRARIQKEREEAARHKAKKEKMLNKQLGGFRNRRASMVGAAAGRGRKRGGRGGKRGRGAGGRGGGGKGGS